VLDLTRVLAGPWCAQLLGDLGADVIKVESPHGGDDTRGWGPPFIGGESAYFLGCNRNKKGVCIDFSSAEGKELLAGLLKRADVVLDNFKTGTMARWGFDDAWFETHASKLVRCSITGYGEQGPSADLPGYDFILQAESGLMSLCGPVGGEPTKYGVAVVDLATGMMAANAVQAALIARYRSGRGQKVEVCLFDTAIALLANVGNSHLATGNDAKRFGNGHPTIVPYTTFACQDASIAIAVGNDGQFAKLAQLLDRATWADDARFERNADRVVHRATIESLIGEITQHWRSAELIAALRQAGIPCGRVNTVAQALADPHTLARGMVMKLAHPTSGQFTTLGAPLKMKHQAKTARYPPPRLGEHTVEVLMQELGLSKAHVEDLLARGIVAANLEHKS
jgi:crotonobetainyl-CoA:carnitine CoA-transferase CaiB-like acyl-CoA transferase